MIEKGKISSTQMAFIMIPTILATAVLMVPAITYKQAQRDLWISPIWGACMGIITILIMFRLNQRYPNQSIIEYAGSVLGKFPGKVVGLLYLVFLLHINGIIIREYGEFVAGTFLGKTPLVVVLGSMLLVCAYAVRGGVEVIARCSQIILPVVILLYLCIVLLLLPDLQLDNMFPIMEHGIMPSVLGSIVPQSWFSEFALITFMLPVISDKKKVMAAGGISVLIVMIIMVITNLAALLLFGVITGSLNYPLMSATRYINLAEFIQHVEAVVMAIWVSGTFLKITIFYYAFVLGTAQYFKLRDFRPLVAATGILLVGISYWSTENMQELSYFLSTSAPFYFLSFQFLLPLLLLTVDKVKNWRGKRKAA